MSLRTVRLVLFSHMEETLSMHMPDFNYQFVRELEV